MARLLFLLAAIAVALSVFAIVDVTLTDSRRARGVAKGFWYVIVLLPFVGPILWFVLGKAPIGATHSRVIAPDDDEGFLKNLRRDEEQEERIRRLEQELSDLDDDPPADK